MTEQITADGKFKRVVELILQTDRADGKSTAYTISGLRIEFRVQKFASALVNNRATIRVYNLQKAVRTLVNKLILDQKVGPYTTVFLSAGYKSEGAGLIFRGVILEGRNERTGPDWISEFTAMTAFQQTASALCDDTCTFLKTPPRVIADRLFSLLKSKTPEYSSEASTILSNARTITVAFVGRIDQALNRFLAGYNIQYTIDDEVPFVIRAGSARKPAAAASSLPLVSPETGLIGAPKITSRGVEIRSLLNPKLKVFERFVVKSETIHDTLQSGGVGRDFTAVKVEHFGSNRDNDFYTEVSGLFFPRIPFTTKRHEPPASFTTNPVQVGGV